MTTTSKKYFILLLIALVLCDAVICKNTNYAKKNYHKAKRANQKSAQTYNGDDNNILQKRNHVNMNDDNDGKILLSKNNYMKRKQQAGRGKPAAINKIKAVTVAPGAETGVRGQVGESQVQIHSGAASINTRVQSGNSKISNLGTAKFFNSDASRLLSN